MSLNTPSHELLHIFMLYDLYDRVHEALGVFFPLSVNVFTSEPLSGVALVVDFSGSALNTIKHQSSTQKNVSVTPEAPTEILLSDVAGLRLI